MDASEIGKLIKQRRHYLGVDQLTVANLSGIGINTLVAIERGKGNPQLSTILSVLETLGLDIKIGLKG